MYALRCESASRMVTSSMYRSNGEVPLSISRYAPGSSAGNSAAAPGGEATLGEGLGEQDRQFAHFQSDAPPCDNCGALTVRCGTCYRCFNCGNSKGCS